MKTEKEILNAPSGLYKVVWISGDTSLAAIGCSVYGTRWIAPTNWLSASRIKHVIHTIDELIPVTVYPTNEEKPSVTKGPLYKLKDEVKKYLTDRDADVLDKSEYSITEWATLKFGVEALEEVKPERIEVLILDPDNKFNNNSIKKHKGLDWTEQEREDVERLLNLGGFSELINYAHLWMDDYPNTTDKDGEGISFNYWLKEQGL